MAESSNANDKNLELNESNSSMECAVCLQTCVHPAELPCGHIFCFLCIKGIAFQSGRCAMCREVIPVDFLFKPKLLPPLKADSLADTYQWYYEGNSGMLCCKPCEHVEESLSMKLYLQWPFFHTFL